MRARSVLVGAAVGMLGTVLAGGTAGAAYPGKPGLIAFQRGGDIYTVQPDGSHVHRLTTDHGSTLPRWSPDGKLIAFDRQHNVWTMSATGTGVKQITHTGDAYQPTWSPNGKQLAFIEVPKGGHGDIYTVAVSGGSPKRVTNDGTTTCGDERPSWSPRGGTILFEQLSCSKNRIMLVNLATGHESQVTADGAINPADYVDAPDFAPDGQHVVLLANCFDSQAGDCAAQQAINVAETDLHGQNRTFFTNTSGTEGDPYYYAPAASTDGTGFVTSETFPTTCPHTGNNCTAQELVWQSTAASGYLIWYYPDGNAQGSLQPDWQP